MSGNTAVLAGATPGGLPWPASTDPANQGANAIKALAEAVETKAPLRAYLINGGWSTNAQGGVAISLPFANPTVVQVTLETARHCAYRASGAPANTLWFNIFDTTTGNVAPNAFFAANICVWGS